ncbi:MAG: AAA family ATPase [Cyanobacteria bacterium P01_F01_bin.150]
MSNWKFFTGQLKQDNTPRQSPLEPIGERPAWRQFMAKDEFEKTWAKASKARWKALRSEGRLDTRSREKGQSFRIRQMDNGQSEIQTAVNSALALRRPLLITGNPGSGKTSLAYAIAYELNLGPVLLWPITTRTRLSDALYQYDAIARLQDTQFDKAELELQLLLAKADDKTPDRTKIEALKKGRNLGDYIQLGPVGTAFLPSHLPRVLLIDEIDKSELNLPNDLLNLFEEGSYNIPELARQKSSAKVSVRTADDELSADIVKGKVTCYEFPLVILTSNGERDFPPAFLRRCLRINMPDPTESDVLERIVGAHFECAEHLEGERSWPELKEDIRPLIEAFAKDLGRKKSSLATDQLLNLIYMVRQSQISVTEAMGDESQHKEKTAELDTLKAILLRRLTGEAGRK